MSTTIPALTIWQPWASLIMLDAKPYEFRGWPAPRSLHGQRIAIHAGARPIKRSEVADLIMRLQGETPWTTGLRPHIALPFLERVHSSPGSLPLSVVLGTVILGQPRHSYEIIGEFGAPINDSDRDQHSNWAWPVSDIQHLEPPVPARGAQGFWRWSPGSEAA
jgi:hypothetical protein